MANFFNYQILADRFVLNLKVSKKTQGAIFPIGLLLMVMGEEEIAWHLGPYPHLNSTCVHGPSVAYPGFLMGTLTQGTSSLKFANLVYRSAF